MNFWYFFKYIVVSFVLLNSFKVQSHNFRDEKIQLAVNAITKLMKELDFLTFKILTHEDPVVDKITNEIVKNSSRPIEVFEVSDINPFIYTYGVSYIFISKDEILYNCPKGNSFSKFSEIQYVKRRTNTYKESIFLNYAYNIDELEMKSSSLEENHRRFLLVHSKNLSSLELYNFVMFRPDSCNTLWMAVNSFKSKTMTWANNRFIQSYNNFYECKIRVFVADENGGYDKLLEVSRDQSGRKFLKGFIGSIMNEAAKRFNYTNHVTQAGDEAGELQVILAPLKLLDDFNPIFAHFHRIVIFSISFTFIVTRGLPFTPMEKLTMPFDKTTWCLLVFSIAVGFFVIFIIYRCAKFVQQFVFGTYIKSPYFNMISIFFGICLKKTPGRNFARFFLTAFMLYCLVIRTAYQAKLFQQNTGNLRKPSPRTVADLLKSKIPLLVFDPRSLQQDE